MRGGAIDAAFIGPGPAINGFSQTKGKLLRIVAGTTSGGAALVVRPAITSVDQLDGKKIATPQLGNTQDIAAKAYFKDKGVKPTIINQENAQTLDLFKDGKIDGGWLPEPWASRLVLDGGGKVLVDEATPVAGRPVRHDAPRSCVRTFLRGVPGDREGAADRAHRGDRGGGHEEPGGAGRGQRADREGHRQEAQAGGAGGRRSPS